MRDNVFTGSQITVAYRGESFTGMRNSLTLEQIGQLYGLVEGYEFSIYASLEDVTEEIRDDERVVLSGAAVGTESLTMRVMGKMIDGVNGVIRLDIKELNA